MNVHVIANECKYSRRFTKKLKFDDNAFKNLHNNIIDFEQETLKKNKKILKKLKNPDVFHKHISSDYSFINKYNKIIEPYNIFVEYYPRIKENGKWHLPNIHIQYVNKNINTIVKTHTIGF